MIHHSLDAAVRLSHEVVVRYGAKKHARIASGEGPGQPNLKSVQYFQENLPEENHSRAIHLMRQSTDNICSAARFPEKSAPST